ncbi:MAG: ABC transporter ATP-binding protein, partial [Anaerolineae bacterium]
SYPHNNNAICLNQGFNSQVQLDDLGHADFLALPDDLGLTNGARLKVRSGTVQFKDVTFSYGDQPILKNLNLTLEGGRTTALVGISGAGKSTLVRLLLHLVKPSRGQVLVDGQDLAGIYLPDYYRQIAYISQEPPVFDGTIRENLVFDEMVDEAILLSAIERAQLTPLISRLPAGLDTVVGECGIKVSGGERQRLAFARLLVQQPHIVVMDEPTSSLDSITEAAVSQNLRDFLTGRTVIIIAHRLQTVQNADRILVLHEGEIVQDGDFASLVEVQGSFREMWEQQSN